MREIINNIFYFKELIESNNGIYYGWEVFYNDIKIAELDFTYTYCGKQDLYKVINVNKDFNDLEIKEILEFKGIYRNKYFKTKNLRPEVDFICSYYPEFNNLGAEYFRIYEHKDLSFNKFYKIVIKFFYFYIIIFPNKGRRDIITNDNCSKMIPKWINTSSVKSSIKP